MPKPLTLVLLWHMHQPEFRDVTTGGYRLPWTGLHAIKDYTDMAAHLERHPRMRCVVNFVPVLLDQLEDYADQVTTGAIRDPLLALLVRDERTPLTADERATTLSACFRGNAEKMIEPFAGYRRLRDLHRFAEIRDVVDYLGDAYLRDLVTWYFLSWTGESVRRDHVLVARLMRKGSGFTATDRAELFALIASLLRDLLPRWRQLAQSGQIELSSTPAFHPIGPLLIDFATARERDATLPLPAASRYPDGAARFDTHVVAALDSHARRFGQAPAGLWPAEGALCDGTLAAFARRGVRWTASGHAVLAGSVPAGRADAHRGWRVGDAGPVCFFRDDRLSDLIGFEYSRWHGEEAAAHFVGELERIAEAAPDDAPPVVSVILDGENAWEWFPYNGWYFLDALYERLADHPTITATTFSDVLDRGLDRAAGLDHLVAGSWVHGTLTTWIGSPDKNRAWDLLCDAKRAHDRVVAAGGLSDAQRDAITQQLAVCEGSDWFWWFGDYNPPEAVTEMDRVYRANLARLYALLGLAPPPEIDQPLSRGAIGRDALAAETGGTMRRAS
jgi:alpha-amylase/alpha-mannosidase (GH57 family)